MTTETEGRAAAERFRRDHHLGVQPLGDLVPIIEQATGIDVAVLDAEPDEHGLTMKDPERGAVFIGVARTPNPMRQRSTLAHELGHALFDDRAADGVGGWSERTPEEIRADVFARHLLVPVAGLREFLSGRNDVSEADLSAVVQRFLVSPAVAAIALHQVACVDVRTKQMWMALSTPQLALRFGWSDQYRALQSESDRTRAPQRLLARAIAGYTEGVASVQTIARLRGIALEDAEAELHEAGMTPTEHRVQWAEPSSLPEPDVDLGALDDALQDRDRDQYTTENGTMSEHG